MSDKLSAEARSNDEEESGKTPILHRVIGSVVIIGLAVIVFSWLLGSPTRTVAPIVDDEQAREDEEVFVSRIVAPEPVKTLEPRPTNRNQDNQDNQGSKVDIEAAGIEETDLLQSVASVPTPLSDGRNNAENTVTDAVNKASEPLDPKAQELAAAPSTGKNSVVKTDAPVKKPTQSSSSGEQAFAKVSGWVVQMGAYSKLPGANATVDQLKEKQIIAKINKSVDNSKTIYRVFVGPFKNRAAAEDASQQIAKRTNMKPFVRKQ